MGMCMACGAMAAEWCGCGESARPISDAEAYRAYDEHPLHLEVRSAILPLISNIATIDYTIAEPAD